MRDPDEVGALAVLDLHAALSQHALIEMYHRTRVPETPDVRIQTRQEKRNASDPSGQRRRSGLVGWVSAS